MFCTFWLGNVLRATTACNCSSLIWPTFRPSGATNHWKNTVFCDFPTFSRTWIFFLLTLSLSSYLLFSSLTLPTSAFHLSILSEVWLLNFLRLLFIFHTSYTIIIIICIFILLFLVLSLLFLLLLLLLYIYIIHIYIYQYYFLLYIKYLMLAKC